MNQNKKMPKFFINAFYTSKFKDNLFVVKAGGKIIEDDAALDGLVKNIKALTLHGIKVLLVYGGGNAMDVEAKKRGIEVKKENGRRITDAATLELMQDVVAGRLSLRINERMARHGLEGYNFGAVPPDWLKAQLRAKEPVDYGFVGEIREISRRAVMRLFKVSNFVAAACLCTTEDGQICNINADTIATQLAVGAKAQKLIFMSDVDGVELNGETALMITAEQIPELIGDGSVTGGMRVKMENCLKALEAGVKRIHLINGLREDALYKEIFESVGPGTMLFKESERQNYMNEIAAQKAIGGAK